MQPHPSSPRPYLPILLMLFVGSGCAALIYEIVWFQLLQLAIGSSAVSLGALLGTFMGGMCLGSILLPKKISTKHHPLRVYAYLELGIGVLGLLVLWAIPVLDRVYAAIAGLGLQGVFLRAVVAAVCLLPPTLLMGASLPAISRWIETTPRGISWLGFFYGGNIAGAVLGCLLAGFYLLRVYDMAFTTYVAVFINAAVGGIALLLANQASYKPVETAPPACAGLRSADFKAVYVVIGLSGMCALGAEVVWTRLLATMMGATVYTFSVILAVFLVGLGIGSSVGSLIARSSIRPRVALGLCQFLAAAGVGWTAFMLADSIPYWPVNPLLSTSPWFNFQIDLVRCFWAVLPATLMWGASFPLAMAAVAAPGEDPGRLAGETYAANTLGAILGALAFSIAIIPLAGTRNAERLLMTFSALAAVLALAYLGKAFAGYALAGCVVVALLIRTVDEVPWLSLAYGRRSITTTDAGEPLYVGEGMNSSVVISQLPSGQRYFHVSGKVEASTEPFDMRLQRMLGHISALVVKDPRSVLIVGFGAGVTAGSFTTYPEIMRIVICEIEKLIPPAATQYFGNENYHVLQDPRTDIHYDDARHFVLTTSEKFDVITSDPIHPWVKGAATLYSKEYFEECKRHLNPGGVITQWVPLYESDPETVKSEIATFFDVFPNGTIWANDNNGQGYDVVLLGQAEPTKIDIDALQARLDQPNYATVRQSLAAVGFSNAMSLLDTYLGRASDLRPWLAGAQINRDIDLRLQYLAGMGVNNTSASSIASEIARVRQFPRDIFTGSPETIGELEASLVRF
jgi:spermidine synthase